MPELHYLDNQNIYAAPRMGAAFSDAVTGLMKLKLMQQQREDERQRTIAEFQLARERLGIERERETREKTSSDIVNRERMSIMDAATKGADAMGRLYGRQQVTTLPNGDLSSPSLFGQQDDIQNIARALAYVRGTNPSAAGRALEPQQFNPGPVYDWNAMLPGGTPQPRFTVPMNPYQAQQVDLKSQAQDLSYQRLQMQLERQQQMLDYYGRLLDEKTRHDKATEEISADKSDPLGVKALMKQRMGGTNAPSSNIKSIRQISE